MVRLFGATAARAGPLFDIETKIAPGSARGSATIPVIVAPRNATPWRSQGLGTRDNSVATAFVAIANSAAAMPYDLCRQKRVSRQKCPGDRNLAVAETAAN